MAFAFCASVGFLTNLTFLFGYAGFGVYTVLRLAPRRDRWGRVIALHALPVLTGLLIYFLSVRGMIGGGGDQIPTYGKIIAPFAAMLGMSWKGWLAGAMALAMAVLIATSVAVEFRLHPARGVFYVVALIATPIVVLFATGREVVYARYFLGPMLIAYVAVACQLARWFRTGSRGRVLVVGFLAGYVACNLAPTIQLISHGRGQYSAAVRWMADHSPGAPVVVASDHDFRNRMLIEFYVDRDNLSYRDRGLRLVYVDRSPSSTPLPNWIIRSSSDSAESFPAKFFDGRGNQYDLVNVYPGVESAWALYRDP